MKPIDGCGSQNVRRLNSAEELVDIAAGRWRIEEHVPGTPASVSVLCGPHRNWSIAACEQRLSDDGHFSYLGGKLPLAPGLDDRACRLARRAIEALPPTIGYLGVDLVLGKATDGSGDYVIEVNPRLTTSYVGLRAASRSNLAAAMLAAASGDEPVLSFRSEPVEFTAAGEILLQDRLDIRS
jgi:predicted ATP-grasp superfamily ATP-dependent carboligase